MKKKTDRRLTAKNIEKAFKPKKLSALRKATLAKAHKARVAHAQLLRSAKKALKQDDSFDSDETNYGALITTVPEMPKPIPRAVTIFVSEMKDYLSKRLTQAPASIELPNSVRCPHSFTVGASAIYRLLQKTYSLDSAHNRVYYHGVESAGYCWEKVVQTWKQITCDSKCYKLDKKYAQITGVSTRYPWLVATPDFIVDVTQGKEQFTACLEVKSTTSLTTFNTISQEFILQVQASMEVFNLQHGFLAVLHVTREPE